MRAHELLTETPPITLKRLHQMKLQRRSHAAQMSRREALFPLMYGSAFDDTDLDLERAQMDLAADRIKLDIRAAEINAADEDHLLDMATREINRAKS